jgi:cobalt-zinc-cadmium efflux system protein
MHLHAHGTDRGSRRKRDVRRLWITLALTSSYMFAEVAGGLWANSLALLADAAHMLSDAGALALALFAIWIAGRPPTPRRTFGYYRVEILAALAHGAVLAAIAIFVVVAAVDRLRDPAPVHGAGMMLIAAGGLTMNLIGLAVLRGGRKHNLNIRGVWLHVLSDALGSVGVLVSGSLILLFGWYWADPAASLIIACLVLWSAWTLLKEVVAVLMEGAPGHIDVDEVRDAIAGQPGVLEVHDLHVWTITSGMESLSGHVVIGEDVPSQRLLRELQELLRRRFKIDHVTIQVETPDFHEDCGTC